jgi:hypothetical protein
MKASQNMIAGLLISDDLNLCAEFARFFSKDRTDTIHGSFVV